MHWAIFMYDLKSESFVRESGYHSTEAECEEERHNLFFPYRFYCLPVPTGKWPAVPTTHGPGVPTGNAHCSIASIIIARRLAIRIERITPIVSALPASGRTVILIRHLPRHAATARAAHELATLPSRPRRRLRCLACHELAAHGYAAFRLRRLRSRRASATAANNSA
jgi:hypothetical protein